MGRYRNAVKTTVQTQITSIKYHSSLLAAFSLSVGASQQFTATGTYSDNSTKTITNSVTWTSSDPGKVAITEAGLVTSFATGTTVISAASASVTGQAALDITAQTDVVPVFDVAIKTVDKYGWNSTSFAQGDEVNIVLTIKNISAEKKTLCFPSGKQYDFVVKNNAGIEVWRWSNGMAFIQIFTSYELEPNETKTISYKWNQAISEDGTTLPAGDYTLAAEDIGISVRPEQNLTITPSLCRNPLPVVGMFDPDAPLYIILFQDGVDTIAETDRLATLYEFQPKYVWENTKGFAAAFSGNVLEHLRCESSIKSIEHDSVVVAIEPDGVVAVH